MGDRAKYLNGKSCNAHSNEKKGWKKYNNMQIYKKKEKIVKNKAWEGGGAFCAVFPFNIYTLFIFTLN